MQRYFDQIDALSDIGAVLRYARDICRDQGVERMSYHVTPLFDEPSSTTTAVYSSGYNKEWLKYYEREGFLAHDPIPERVLNFGAMMTWKDAALAASNSPIHDAYFESTQKFDLIHGFGIPLFGPRSRDAYASIDFGRPVSEISKEQLGIVRSVAQAGHQRICVLLDQTEPIPALSEREVEVLTWTAKGKSYSAIATILGLSPDTVKTYSKRIYAKLDVTDRVGAVVKALKLGLVRI